MPLTPASHGFRGTFQDDLTSRAVYSEAAGIARIMPRAVAVPVDEDDTATLVRWAAERSVPLIPRGSGSSMAGGAIGDGVIVDLSRLDAIEPPDASRGTIRCGPGAIRDAVDAAARVVGLRFPVDPSSGAFCTVGGMASTNASGAHTLKYGSTRSWIVALDCVFADGSRGELRRGVPAPELVIVQRALRELAPLMVAERASPSRHAGVRKESSGYGLSDFALSGELVDLIAGSEGTLALIVGLELRLAPLLPHSASVLGAFATLEDAMAGAEGARRMGAVACEALDRTFLDVARRGGAHVPVSELAESVLLAEVEAGTHEEASALVRGIEAEFRRAGATEIALALDPATEHALWEIRHAASPILNHLDPSLTSMQLIEDGCVPPERLAEYVIGVRAALDRQHTRGVIFGHAGDAHYHVNALVEMGRPDWRSRVDALLDEVTSLIARLGGTLSGEHGDGRLRAPLLDRVWSADALARFAAVKCAFDSAGILNPGAKVASAGARAVTDVKYDPMLPPLPERARAVLVRVERERAYARSRLELLAEATKQLDARAGSV